jgi:hypothetical protein
MSVNVHIQRLVIDDIDFDPRQAKNLKSAIQAELAHRVQVHGPESLSNSNRRNKPIDGGSVSFSQPLKTETFGRQIGNAVFRSIRNEM